MDILILHGWGSSSKNWARVKEILGNQGYRVFVPDLPGFGDSLQPPTPWAVDNYVEWVKDFSEKNNLGQFFLLGHSFGGGVAVKFTGNFPEKVKKLILLAPALKREKTLKYYIFLVLAKAGKFIFSLPGLSLLQHQARKGFYTLIGRKDYYRLELGKAVRDNTMKETLKKIVSEDLLSYLSKIKNKTLIIWGGKDKLTPLKEAYLIKKELNNSALEIIPNIGHAINLEAPEKLAEIVLRFLKEN